MSELGFSGLKDFQDLHVQVVNEIRHVRLA